MDGFKKGHRPWNKGVRFTKGKKKAHKKVVHHTKAVGKTRITLIHVKGMGTFRKVHRRKKK